MEQVAGLVKLTPAEFAALVSLFLPGFVSLRVDRLIHPGAERSSADDLINIVGYSILNAGVFSWAIAVVARELAIAQPNYFLVAGSGLLTCLIGPVCWPLVFRLMQREGWRRGWVTGAHRHAWDHYFSRRQYGFVIVHLTDGTHIGGYFGPNSYATVEPDSGHLYLEELWSLDAEGGFVGRIPDSAGALFRASDYKWVEFFEDDADDV